MGAHERTEGRVLPSGVPGFDQVLGGGIPRGDPMLIIGPPGSGKTTLACQVAFKTAAAGHHVVFLSTLSEPASRLVKHLAGFSFWDPSLIGRNISLSSVQPVLRKGDEALLHTIVEIVRARGAALLVLDGMATLRGTPAASGANSFIHDLALAVAPLGCTTIFTYAEVAGMRLTPPELTMSDSVVELAQVDHGGHTTRTLRVWKLRGAASLLGSHTACITSEGISVYPRIELLPIPAARDLGQEPVPLGLPELDAMMMGGLPRGSSTIVAGACGTGKTLLALQCLRSGARAGESTLFVSLRETSDQLLRRGACPDAEVTMLYLRPVPLEPDVLLTELWNAVMRTGATRLAIDSITELLHILPVDRQRSALAALLAMLRARAVTTLLVHEIPQRLDAAVDFADTPIGLFAENVLLLRDIDHGGYFHRIASIPKMRNISHDRSIRQLELGPDGVRVLSRAESPEGLLQALAARASEQRAGRAYRAPSGADEEME